MQVGLDTLLLMTVDIEAMLGLLLLFTWVQNTSIQAVAWWGLPRVYGGGRRTFSPPSDLPWPDVRSGTARCAAGRCPRWVIRYRSIRRQCRPMSAMPPIATVQDLSAN